MKSHLRLFAKCMTGVETMWCFCHANVAYLKSRKNKASKCLLNIAMILFFARFLPFYHNVSYGPF